MAILTVEQLRNLTIEEQEHLIAQAHLNSNRKVPKTKEELRQELDKELRK